MQNKLWLTGALVLSLAVAAPGCDTLTGGDDDGGVLTDGSLPPDAGAPPSGLLTTKKAGETIEADFASGSEEYLVVPYSVSTVSTDFIEFEVKLSGGKSSSSKSYTLKTPRPAPLKQRNPALYRYWQQRLAVEGWARQQAAKAAKMPLVPDPSDKTTLLNGASCTASSDCAASEVCSGGTCTSSVNIKVSAFSSKKSITAEVKGKGTHAAVLVDSSDTVKSSTVDAMLDKFDKVIYPRDIALFGNPPLKSGGSTLSADRNGDGLVWLVVSSTVSEKMSAVGFFNATDFAESGGSNKADILYVDAASASKLSSVYPIMAHEYQHLLSFANKVYRPKANGKQGAQEALWLDEGLAHFAEGACGFGAGNVTLLDQEVFTMFSETSVFGATDSTAMRGMAYLYVRYLFEQAGGVTYKSDGSIVDNGGAAFLKKIHGTTKQSTAAINHAFGDYKTAFDNWVAAVGLDGRNVTDYRAYNYQPVKTDPVTGNTIGIKVRGKRTDSTGASVTLQGPLEDPLSSDTFGEITNATAKYYRLKGKSGKVKVTVKSKADGFRFALIQLK
jgi:hypothetical protein